MPPEITRERLNFSMNRRVKWRTLSKKMDKFGRPYIVWLDRNNLEPTGQVERAFNVNADNEGRAVDVPDLYGQGTRGISFPADYPWRVQLDLEGYARFLKRSLAEWELRYKDIRDTRPKGEPEERALQMVGPKPQDWRLIVLMSRGDPWCLGKTSRRTAAVEALIGKAPTRSQLRMERERPRDLRLDPELEALIGKGVDTSYPDELDRELANADLSVTDEDLDDAGLDIEEVEAEMEGEDILTGNLDLDDVDLDDETGDDLGDEIEEIADPKATGGKRENPRKNRRRPARED